MDINKFLLELRPNAAWWLIEKVMEATFVTVLLGVVQKLREVPWDWWVMGTLFAASLGFLIYADIKSRRVKTVESRISQGNEILKTSGSGSKQWVIPFLCGVVVALLIFVAFFRVENPPAPIGYIPKSHIENVEGKTFVNTKVPLDGRRYINCKFSHVTFVYEGKALPGGIMNSYIEFSKSFDVGNNESFSRLVQLMAELKIMGSDTEFFLNNKPLDLSQGNNVEIDKDTAPVPPAK
jgi:hypothetical protein